MTRSGALEHAEFLDLSGQDPSRAFAESLVAHGRDYGPVFVYNAAFERIRIEELAEALRAINARIADLLPIAREYYYHPGQQGRWSIKAVLPTIAPFLD